MSDILKTIIDVEKESADTIDRTRADLELLVNGLIREIEKRRSEEKKRIIEENIARYKLEVDGAADKINSELERIKNDLSGLKNNAELRDAARERIQSIIFSPT